MGAGIVCCAAASYEGGGSLGVGAYLVSAMISHVVLCP